MSATGFHRSSIKTDRRRAQTNSSRLQALEDAALRLDVSNGRELTLEVHPMNDRIVELGSQQECRLHSTE